jgi:cytochrome bd-type quinol oxidase subunit 2
MGRQPAEKRRILSPSIRRPFAMPQPTLRQRKTFALIRVLGGLVAALYLGYVVIANLAAGLPFDGALRVSALIAIAGFAYAAWYLRDLSAVAREERDAGRAG